MHNATPADRESPPVDDALQSDEKPDVSEEKLDVGAAQPDVSDAEQPG
ncbi:hypothetical protein GTW71_18525, partial [Streptomyces sp. SID6041]|nr:hypothetical protein [Streptomyces sp. SID6041]